MKYQIYSSADGKITSRFNLPHKCTHDGIEADSFLEACQIYYETYDWIQGKFRYYVESGVPYIQNIINTELKTSLHPTWEEAIANSAEVLEINEAVYDSLVSQGIIDASSCDN